MKALGLVLAAVLAVSVAALAVERSSVPEKYTWNQQDLYATKAAWEADRDAVAKRIPEIAAFKDHLGDSAQGLLKALQTSDDIEKQLSRVYLYAAMSADVNTKDAAAQAMRQSVEKIANDFSTAASYFEPEILAIDPAKLDSFLASEPGLKPYKPVLDNIVRMRAHTLSPAEEKVAARLSAMAGAPSSIYSIFTNADLPYAKDVKLPSGEVIPLLDAAAYAKYRALPNREDRDFVFKTFWTTYGAYKRTLGTSLYSVVKNHMAFKDVNKYDSCLAMALDGNNIPVAVYKQLVSDVHTNLPTLHRYLKLRQRMMGVDQLRYEDLYAPIVKQVEMDYTPEQAMEITLKAVAPLGPDYTAALKKGFESRWIDWMPTTGKRSGAYSTGSAYDVHPYQLLNFNGKYDDVSTLAHESGHSMHSNLSNTNQPYATAHYSIFVAEVASTLNENLLFHEVLDQQKDDSARLYLLGERLDGFRQTLFRQTLFAEFEMRIHEMAEAGQPLTGDSLTKLYLDLVKTYYGDAAGVCKVDDLYGTEWSYIPHFYRNFYVYQYATSMVASSSLAERIRLEAAQKPTGGKKPVTTARDAYLKMLSGGSSKYPIDLLKDAGVDMTTSAPFNAAIAEMNAIMDQMEVILKKQI
jgi:oligoendopeptidase F